MHQSNLHICRNSPCCTQTLCSPVCLSVVLKAASLTVDLCGEEQEPGYCAVSNVAVHTDW